MSIPVTAAGQSVAVVCDKSGNGRHIIQANAASRPTYQSSGGKHWLQFDGVDDSLSAAAFAWGSDEATLLFGVRKERDSEVGCLLETSNNSNTSNGNLAVFMPNATLNAGVYEFRSKGSLQTTVTKTAGPTGDAVLSTLSKIGTDTAFLRINGADVASGSADQGSGNYGNLPLFVGRRSNANFPILGRIYGIAAYNRVLGVGELETAENWMAAKAEVTL